MARPSELRAYLVAQSEPDTVTSLAGLVVAAGGAKPQIEILELETEVPWAGHSARYAILEILQAVARHKLTLVFVNTRMQAELVFQELWRVNEANLPIGLHHGSLDRTQRTRVETAMAEGRLRAVVCTSTLDLGLDWGDVDLVINVGAPKGASRLIQRIGRANHRLDEPSKAILVPANRFEVLECRAALDAAMDGTQDVTLSRTGTLDVLAQHVLGTACAGPFEPRVLFDEVRAASPYSGLKRETFDRVHRVRGDGWIRAEDVRAVCQAETRRTGAAPAQPSKVREQYRMNAGTIVETPPIKVRLIRARRVAKAGTAGGAMMAGACSAMSTRRSSSSFRRAIRSCSRARCCVSRGCARRRLSSAARKSRTRKCRATGAASSRFDAPGEPRPRDAGGP